MKRLLPLTLLIFLFSSAVNPPDIQKNAIHEEAMEIAIADFLKCRLIKNHKAFAVTTYERGEYDRYEISDELIFIGISPVETTKPQYYITPTDTLGSTRLPTRYIIKEGKLFFWRDTNYGLTKETINVFRDYNLVDLLENSEFGYILGQESYGDDFQKTAQYYFCKNNLTKYKRVFTSIAPGWYEPPKLKCK